MQVASTAAVRCVAVCCCVLQCVAVCCSVLQCVAVCCSVLQVYFRGVYSTGRIYLSGAVCCSVLQCVAVCCSVLQYTCNDSESSPVIATSATCS